MNGLNDHRHQTFEQLKVKAVDAEGNVTLLNVRELISNWRQGYYEIEITVDLPSPQATKR